MAQSACNLISRSVIRAYLISIHHFDIFGSWLVIRAQRAHGNPSQVSHYSFHVMIDHLNGWISSRPPIDDRFIRCRLFQNGPLGSSQQQES